MKMPANNLKHPMTKNELNKVIKNMHESSFDDENKIRENVNGILGNPQVFSIVKKLSKK
ncbi:hypothetical protein [Companilactobacillus mishanensis]|uniref:hypothetical protein n=1 Tax=Companilactobacillus mishanensis TaxID=2486008 RepID=UPI001297F011|nr:hypothetical protein [Companilactobacillus mishanensis]